MDVIQAKVLRNGRRMLLMGLLPLVGASVHAEPPAVTLPAGPGKAQLEADCSSCHGPDMVTGERHDAAGWEGVVETMVDRGAEVSAPDKAAIIAYLAAHFGPQGKETAKPTKP